MSATFRYFVFVYILRLFLPSRSDYLAFEKEAHLDRSHLDRVVIEVSEFEALLLTLYFLLRIEIEA